MRRAIRIGAALLFACVQACSCEGAHDAADGGGWDASVRADAGLPDAAVPPHDSSAPLDRDARVEVDADASVVIDADASVEVDADAGVVIDADARVEVDADAGAVIDLDAGVEVDADAGVEVDADAGSDDDAPAVLAIKSGHYHTCALMSDGKVRCTGDGNWGQLGTGEVYLPALVPAPVPGITDAIALSAGGFHSCAVREDGTVTCWGDNRDGQLGDGQKLADPPPAPVQVNGLTGIVAVSAGDRHTCALAATGAVACWGNNDVGQLGDDSTVPQTTPVRVKDLDDATAIATGEEFSCALREGGNVVCWGSNFMGQLGDGTTMRRLVPTPVPGLSNAVEIEAGLYNVCARLVSGAVSCWGNNIQGQVGSGTSGGELTMPTAVLGLSDATSVSVGAYHACAVRAHGGVVCWGYGGEGGLGHGELPWEQPTFVTVSGLSAALLVDTGAFHSCALTPAHEVLCWGYNQDGEVGDGTQINRYVPVPTLF